MGDFDFEPPSFSLGFDLDSQSEPQPAPRPDPQLQTAKDTSTATNLPTIEEDHDDDDFESPVRVSDPQMSGPPRAFKRLRRGPTDQLTPKCNVDDDIEDFSSDEDRSRGNHPNNSVCSSSKSSLLAQSVLTSESGSQWKSVKRKEVSSASASADLETNGSNGIFPKLTISPLRRFQLIDSDSDSDDPSVSEDFSKEVPSVTLSSKDKQSDCSRHAALKNLATEKASVSKYQTEDLWKDSVKSPNISTPAFDEFSREYFSSVKEKGNAKVNPKNPECGTNWDASLHPANFYFFHEDPRIQKLVRDRLPHFFPLGAENDHDHKQPNTSIIDYMGQFGHGDNSRPTNQKRNVESSSSKSKRGAKKSQVENMPQDEGWVNPKSCAGLPKNAGNRRVQAVSKSAGHWFTGSDGRRVYVNKSGQELTGKIAYAQYRKENGMGFKNSKKQTAAKKKTAAGKKSTQRKK